MKTAIELAREAGATPYTNRHMPDRPFHTFSPEQLEKLIALVRAEYRAELLAGSGERPCHVFNATKNGPLIEWEPTTIAFALPDGTHPLYTTEAVAAAVLRERERLTQPPSEQAIAAAIAEWFSPAYEYNSSMETRMRAAIEVAKARSAA